MRSDDLLEAYRESAGPDADARSRLMGRLAALGPPAEPSAPDRRVVWPWVVAAATLAAAAVALWIAPRGQQVAHEQPSPTLASDRAADAETNGVVTPQTPPSRRRTDDGSEPEPEPESEPEAQPEFEASGEPEVQPEPKTRPRARTRMPRTPPAAPEPESPAPEADTLGAEAILIGKARAALSRGDAARALEHLEAFADAFTAPRLHEEAAALRAMAQCAGNPNAKVSAAFSGAYARSMFRARVRKACEPESERKPAKNPEDERTPEKPDMHGR